MTDTMDKTKINFDGTDYFLDDLSENAQAQLTNIQFVDIQLQQLQNELAVSDTARIGYTKALKADIIKFKSSSS